MLLKSIFPKFPILLLDLHPLKINKLKMEERQLTCTTKLSIPAPSQSRAGFVLGCISETLACSFVLENADITATKPRLLNTPEEWFDVYEETRQILTAVPTQAAFDVVATGLIKQYQECGDPFLTSATEKGIADMTASFRADLPAETEDPSRPPIVIRRPNKTHGSLKVVPVADAELAAAEETGWRWRIWFTSLGGGKNAGWKDSKYCIHTASDTIPVAAFDADGQLIVASRQSRDVLEIRGYAQVKSNHSGIWTQRIAAGRGTALHEQLFISLEGSVYQRLSFFVSFSC
jgi:hypothetical protein